MTPKGPKFELAVFRILERSLVFGRLGISPSNSLIFHNKAYFSRDRNKDIVTDVSIEIFISDATSPSILWVWECKEYSKPVPVDDVEEFHAKLEQIGADRTKGTIITSATFQHAAIEYARSKGIGIARLLPRKRVEHVLLSPSNSFHTVSEISHSAITALTDPEFTAHVDDFPLSEYVYGFSSAGIPRANSELFWLVLDELRTWELIP